MSQRSKHLYEFGPFRLDPGERLLVREGDVISLTPKAFDLLLTLVEHHGHLLEKEELLKLVWPNTFVEEANLSWNISHVRKALDENGNGQRFIETVPKRGYRFVASVRRVEDSGHPDTEEPTPPESSAENSTIADRSSADAALKPKLAAIRISETLSMARPSNGMGLAPAACPTPPVKLMQTDRASAEVAEIADDVRLSKHERWTWIAATALAALTVFGVVAYYALRPGPEVRMMKLSLLPLENSTFDHVVISPDGRWLAFIATTGGKTQLWVCALDTNEAKALPGTEGARLCFWSPDSHHLGFFAGRKLKKIEVPSGLSGDLCDVGVGTGGAWGLDGVILVASLGGTGISRVSADGGDVTSVIRADLKRGETDYKDPSFLPDGRHFLYFNSSGQKELSGVYVASLDGRVNHRIIADDSNAIYATSITGGTYLLFGRQGSLMAQRFDTSELRLADEPFSVAGQVGRVLGTHARRDFSVSENGVVVLDPLPHRQCNQVIWVDRAGRRTNQMDGPQTQNPSMPRLSPDDTRLIVSRFEGQRGSNDLWLSDLTSGNDTRFTFDPATDLDAVWSGDGSHIAWCSNREGQYDLYQRAANGEGKDELLCRSEYPKHPTDWSRDGRFIIYQQPDPKTRADVWAIPVASKGGDQKPIAILQTAANEGAAVLSPDGQWMAYISDESGEYEVYVQIFPTGGGKRQVSTDGGQAPLWRADGKELFYHAKDGNLMAVRVKLGPRFEASKPEPLFAFRAGGIRFIPYYSVTSDGQRFLLSTIVATDTTTPLTVMVNWSADLPR